MLEVRSLVERGCRAERTCGVGQLADGGGLSASVREPARLLTARDMSSAHSVAPFPLEVGEAPKLGVIE